MSVAPLKILIVDDSLIVQSIVSQFINKDPAFELVGKAENGQIALQKIETLRPDVIILDIEMPVMDGFGVLDQIKKMSYKPYVIMFSTLTSRGAEQTIKALTLGATDYIPKPSAAMDLNSVFEELTRKLKQFKPVIHLEKKNNAVPFSQEKVSITPARPPVIPVASTSSRSVRVISIGVSTGGPDALLKIIPRLTKVNLPPVLIVQHMPPLFTKQLANQLNSQSKLNVLEGEEGMVIQAGHIYIAPGGRHMTIEKKGISEVLALNDNPPENFCRPAADVLFRSVAKIHGKYSLNLILTGMGRDGFEGMKELKSNGGYIIAQDQESCVVYGMPSYVVNANLADEVLPLNLIASRIESYCISS